jgi:opioid growth factor receptor-like protein
MSVDSAADPVVAFYAGGRDGSGRTLSGILEWDDEQLEAVHDYIQWVFPTKQPSGVNPFAPLVTDATVRAFADDAALRGRLREALDRMLVFYGLARSGDRVVIEASRFPARARGWLRPGNHNHLRLTRIMESLATLGLRADALALQRCLLEDIVGRGADAVSPRTAGFWKRALE